MIKYSEVPMIEIDKCPVVSSLQLNQAIVFKNHLYPTYSVRKEYENTTSLSTEIFNKKYLQTHLNEIDRINSFNRIDTSINKHYPDKLSIYNALYESLFMPAGRILAGLGTGKRVTLMNCYVNGEIEDSMEGIIKALGDNMLTLQQGGGMGTCFSTIRPKGAILRRTYSDASGPLPFMDTFDASCNTIKSAGARRGAMMATISDTHPDMPAFVTAKQQPGRLTNFNVSVLISDAFMAARADNADWLLYFDVPPLTRLPELEELDFVDDEGVQQYVYSKHKARDLWDLIIKNTYDYAEPGIIFIDRVNDLNNLNYCETITAPNPCGEQMLGPHNACNLAANNLAYLVKNPFTDEAQFDFEQLAVLTSLGVIFLDRIIDISNYPLPEQEEMQRQKRRIGLGFSGLADAMAFLGIRYGSAESEAFAEKVQKVITFNSYYTSCLLAKAFGRFPLWSDEYINNPTSFVRKLPEEIKSLIAKYGIRNSLLNTIAPTGTTSIAFGNVSSGLEPIFAHKYDRFITQEDGSKEKRTEYSLVARVWTSGIKNVNKPLPAHCVTAQDLSVNDHLVIQAACQKWIDASVSKTINCPEDMPYEDFEQVYLKAYNMGCKGCTTYRPSGVRGSILSVVDESKKPDTTVADKPKYPLERAAILEGKTLKVTWPALTSSLYITVNFSEGQPFEIFFNSKDQKYMEWMTAITILLSWVLRQGMSLNSIAQEFKQVASVDGGAWVEGKFQPSLIAYLGKKLSEVISIDGNLKIEEVNKPIITEDTISNTIKTQKCPSCGSYHTDNSTGCLICYDCNWSKCS